MSYGIALANIESEYVYSLEQEICDYKKQVSEYEHMIDWMERNSNSSLHDYYNREEG